MVLETEPRVYADWRQIELLRKRKKAGTLGSLQLTQPLWLRKEVAAELGFNAGESDFELEPLPPEAPALAGRIPQPFGFAQGKPTITPQPTTTTPPPFVPTKITPRPAPTVTPVIPQPTPQPSLETAPITLSGDYGLLFQEYQRTGGTLDVISWGAAGAPLRPGMETEPTDEGLQKFLNDLVQAGQVSDVENLLRLAQVPESEIDRIVGVETRQRELEDLLTRTFPDLDIEGFANLVETDPDAFVDRLRTGGRTKEKQDLLRLMGFEWEDIGEVFRVQKIVTPVDGVRKLVTFDENTGRAFDQQGKYIGAFDPITREIRPLTFGEQVQDFKDAWSLASIGAWESTKEFALTQIPKLLFRDMTPLERKIQGDEWADETDRRNKELRDSWRATAVGEKQKYGDWVRKNPQLAPRPDYEEGASVHPELWKDPWWWAYEVASMAPASATALIVGVAATGMTGGNWIAGAIVAGATFYPQEVMGVRDDLLSEGIPEDQVDEIALITGVPIVMLESAGRLPLLWGVSPTLKRIFRREATKEIVRLTKRELVKRGILTFTGNQFGETMTEVLQEAIGNAAVKLAGADRSLFENLDVIAAKTFAGVAPTSLFGGMGAMVRVSPSQTKGMSNAAMKAKGWVQDVQTGNWYEKAELPAEVQAGEVVPEAKAPEVVPEAKAPVAEVSGVKEGVPEKVTPAPDVTSWQEKIAEAQRTRSQRIDATPEGQFTEVVEGDVYDSGMPYKLVASMGVDFLPPGRSIVSSVLKQSGETPAVVTIFTGKPAAIPKAEAVPEAVAEEAKPLPVTKETLSNQVRQIHSELEADVNIARKKIAEIKTPLPTQGADVQFARLALNDAERLLKQNQTLINRIERGEQVSQTEIDALNDELASVKDALKFQIKDVAKARTYLTRYVRENVPLAERGKLLTAISKIQGAQDIDAVVQRANEIAEQSEKSQLRAEIIRELKRAKPRKVEGIVKGRFGGDMQTELDIMNRSLKMTRDDALAKIQANQQAYDAGTMSYEDMVRDNSRLNFTGIEGMTATELADTLDYIKTLKGVGMATRIAELEKWREGIDKAKTDITKVVTGGKAVEPGVTKEFTGFKGLLKRIEGGQVALTDFLDILSGTDKSSKPYSSDLNLFVDDRVLKSYNAEQDGLVATGDTIRDNFKRVFNIKKDREANDILRRIGKEKVRLGTFQNTEGKSVKLELTKGQMIDAYNLMQASENLPTFTEGNKFTQEMQNAISNGLSAQEKAWADWQRSFLADYWTGINGIYEPLYGVKLGRNENYWPRNRDIERSDVPEHILVQEDYNHFASVTNGSLKARTQNKIPFKFLDANTKLLNHVTQMEHFKAWANTIRDLRSVFMSRDIKNAIHQFYGREIGNKIDDYISVLARGGIEKAKRVHILDTLRGNVAVSVLGIKPMIAIKQPTALLAYATEMPYGDFISGVTNFLKNPVANYKTLYEKSASLRARYRAGQYERDIKVGVEGGVPTNLSGKANWKERVLTLIQLGDQFGTVPGMWAKYQSELKAGSTDAQAILEAEKLTNRTQNTSQLFTLTTIQHGGSWARLLTMFQDQPNKYFRLINSNFRNMINGRQGIAKSVSNIALLWVVIPVLFQWMSDAFQWREERQLRAAALGPLNMLLIIGQATQSVVGWATGEKYPYEPSPVLQIADDIQAAISKMRKLIADGQDPFKDVSMDDVIGMIEFFVKSIGMTTGVPTPYLVQLERVARGKEGKRDWRELLFSRWALEEPKLDLSEKSNDAGLKLGLLKETTGKEDTDKLPEISNTADYFSEQKKNFNKTLPADITEKNGFDKRAVAVGQAFIAEDEYFSQPNKRLHQIVDDIEKDESINYTVTQYYLDWHARSKIISLAKLKEFDDTHPRAYLGNLTPDQLSLLVEYENTPKEQRKQFLLDHKELNVNPRHDWLKKNSKQNALLAVFGQADLLTPEAYTEFKRLIKELDIPDSAIPEMTLPPETSLDTHFSYQDMVSAGTHGSWEAQLLLKQDAIKAKEAGVQSYVDWRTKEGEALKLTDTPMASLELKTEKTYRETYLKLADSDFLDTLDDKVKDKDGLTARDRAIAELKATKIGDMSWIDLDRKITAIEKGTDEKPVPDELVSAYVERGKLIDQPSIGSGSAEVMLQRVDNPDFDAWLTDEDVWGDNALKPVDQTKIPTWRIDVKYRKEDAEYQAILDKNEGRDESTATKAYLDAHPEYRQDRRRRQAYGLSHAITGYKFPTTEVENFVAYNEIPQKGKRRERFLVENTAFAKALYDAGQIADLPDPAKVPAVQFDDIYDQFPDQFDEIENNGKPESDWFEPDEGKRESRDKELRFDDTGKYTEFGLAEIRRNAYGALIPETYTNPEAATNPIDDYVGYYTIQGEGKPADYPENVTYWEDDWWMIEHPEFYKQVYLNPKYWDKPHQRKDYRLVPTRAVGAKYLVYVGLTSQYDKDKYRLDNPDLDEWGVLKGIWAETMTEKRRRLSISSAERIQAEIDERLRKLKEAVGSR